MEYGSFDYFFKEIMAMNKNALIAIACTVGAIGLTVGTVVTQKVQADARREKIHQAWLERQANPEKYQAEIDAVVEAANQDKKGFDPAEIKSFKDIVGVVDPNGLAIKDIRVDTVRPVVSITGTAALFAQSDLQLSEMILNLKNVSDKTCDCTSVLVFKTQAGQTVAKSGMFGGVDILAKNR